MSDECPIWGTPADVDGDQGDYKVVNSPRAGGGYWISRSAEAVIEPWGYDQNKRLTTWLCEQRAAGIRIPRINTDTLELVKSRKLLSVSQRVQSALLFLRNLKIGDYPSLGNETKPYTLKAFAETESLNAIELRALYNMLKESGYVDGNFRHPDLFSVAPTLAGWNQIESLEKTTNSSSQAFVAMWFDQAMDGAYTEGIAPAVAATGHKPLRIDNKEHNNKIDDEIIAEIRRSRFLIADFTCKPKEIRGGVYYEAGFAMGIGIPVIWTCRKGSEDDLHFDTRQYAHIIWESPQDLLEKLKNRIGAVIGDGPLPKS